MASLGKLRVDPFLFEPCDIRSTNDVDWRTRVEGMEESEGEEETYMLPDSGPYIG